MWPPCGCDQRENERKKERQQQQHGLPRSKTFYTTRKGRVPNATFPLYNGKKEVFTNDIRKRIKRVDDQSSKRRTSFFPISSALPFSLSLFSLARRKAQQPTRALASYVLFGSERGITNVFQSGCRAAQFISSCNRKKAQTQNKKRVSKSLSPRRPRAPERPTPRALAMPKSLSSADVDRCARFAGRKKGGGGGGARVFFSLLEERLFVFHDPVQAPPAKCEKVSAFFCFFVFFLDEKERFFFSLFFSCCGCFGLE